MREIPESEIEVVEPTKLIPYKGLEDNTFGTFMNAVQRDLDISVDDMLFKYNFVSTIYEYWNADISYAYCVDELKEFVID